MEACSACDVRDPRALAQAVHRARAEVVIHMAAQSLVRQSLREPLETYAVNALGTASLLEAVRESPDTEAVVVVTSDKCYAPRAGGGGHVEQDALGGEDPYSSSKACAELVVAGYRDSFFSTPTRARVASARAGNVIGGGDFSPERLLPDVFAAALRGEPVLLRNPDAVRPWQHVLSPLSGYLALAQALCEREGCDCAWNFGPAEGEALAVRELVERVSSSWDGWIDWRIDEREHPPENQSLRLDSTRARVELGWEPLCTLEQGIAWTVEWYRAHGAGEDLREATLRQLPRLGERVF
jgi:CDP-glucose 4,6-dehydratase